MSVLTGKELRIVGFLCNWCSYGGADTAGVARFTQPTDLRITVSYTHLTLPTIA